MKKISVITILLGALLFLSACGSNEKMASKSGETSQASTTSEMMESTSKMDKKLSVFTGSLVEDTTQNEDEGKTIRLVLEKIEAVEDPDQVINTMKADGVVLNVTTDLFADGLDETKLVAGDKIRFTLTGLPIMTMSIPPQIPGNSISLVEKLE